MKKCPQCEFIYEDDQSLCDMDGVLLVFDSRTLPNHHALATVPADPPKAARRNRAVPAFATLVLALVLGMVYYVSTRRPNPVPTPAAEPSALSIAPVAIPTPEPQPTAEPTPEKEEAKPASVKQSTAPAPAPGKKQATKATSNTQAKRDPEPKKEENKVNSILKKTGRILKKPFKF
jgi:hypothetical protein